MKWFKIIAKNLKNKIIEYSLNFQEQPVTAQPEDDEAEEAGDEDIEMRDVEEKEVK